MSDFVVSARKYRPQRFDEVVGQGHVSETLKNALRQDRLAHAFLFCGPRGVGKTTNARILAKVLNCLNVGDDYEPCNTCDNCIAFNQNASFNIFELDGASNNKVDHMHQLMEQVRVPPQSGRKKVYIIDEVHMLTSAAFNAFLKTLEEPPEYAVFILATTEKHKVLPTILSRCQVYDFHRIRPGDMVNHLEQICREEGIVAEPEALHLVAEKADGALRDALSIFDRLISAGSGNELTYDHAATQLNVLDHSTFFQVTDALLREDVASLYLLFDQVLANGFEPEPFLTGLSRHLRQLFVCKSPATRKLLEVSDTLAQRYSEQANKAPMSFLANALNLAAECDFRLRQTTNKRLHVELYLVKMAFAQRTVSREGIVIGKEELGNEEGGKRKEELGNEEGGKSKKELGNEEGGIGVAGAAVAEAVAPVTETKPLATAAGGVAGNAVSAVAAQPGPSTARVIELPKTKTLAGAAGISISFEEEEEEPEHAAVVDPESLSLDTLRAAWQEAATKQPKRIASVMRRAKLDYTCPKLTVRVGSLMAQNTLRTEAMGIRDIKDALNCPGLNIIVEHDAGLAPKEAKKPKAFGPKEQYQALLNINPEVDTLRKRFGLELEE